MCVCCSRSPQLRPFCEIWPSTKLLALTALLSLFPLELFSAEKQRNVVVVRKPDGSLHVMAKGSPEMMRNLGGERGVGGKSTGVVLLLLLGRGRTRQASCSCHPRRRLPPLPPDSPSPSSPSASPSCSPQQRACCL